MPKCPYCNADFEIKLEITPGPIDDKFKNDFIKTYENFIDLQAEIMPFGGKMMKKMANYSLKFVNRYLDQLGAIPIVVHSCANCGSVITTESMLDLMSSRSGSSS